MFSKILNCLVRFPRKIRNKINGLEPFFFCVTCSLTPAAQTKHNLDFKMTLKPICATCLFPFLTAFLSSFCFICVDC